MDVVSSDPTEWKYITYEKIPENLHQWQLTESDYRLFKKTDWVVTEKIHGANFGISTNGLEVRFAKRKEFLQPGEDFFNYLSLQAKLAQQAKEIFRLLQSTMQLQRIYIYGELFGGEYPHPEVKAVAGLQAIQTGVYYSPQIEYCAFDIAILENQTSLEKTYLNYDHALDLFYQVGMMGAEPLFIGKYEDAMAYPIEFESKIPDILGLPKLTFANKAEGIVIKPLKTIYIQTSKGKIRPVIKKKIPEFAEDCRFHQAKKWHFRQLLPEKRELSIEEELTQEMLALVTPTRLNNIISKLGRISQNDTNIIQELVAQLMNDILETFHEDYGSIFCLLENEVQQNMLSQLQKASEELVKHYFNK